MIKFILKGLEFVNDTFRGKVLVKEEYMCLFMDDYLLMKVTESDINIMKITFLVPSLTLQVLPPFLLYPKRLDISR